MLKHLKLYALLFLVNGCASGDSSSDTDCRNNGIGCTLGFACTLNQLNQYECLPNQYGGSGENVPSQNTPPQNTNNQNTNNQSTNNQNGGTSSSSYDYNDTQSSSSSESNSQSSRCVGYGSSCEITSDCCQDDVSRLCVDNICMNYCEEQFDCPLGCCVGVTDSNDQIIGGVCTLEEEYCEEEPSSPPPPPASRPVLCREIIDCIGQACDAQGDLSDECFYNQTACFEGASQESQRLASGVYACARYLSCDLSDAGSPNFIECIYELDCQEDWRACVNDNE